jgi:Fe-S oxidoreductase
MAPALVNFVTQTPGLRDVAKAIAGISFHRSIPRFARQTFVSWFKQNRTQKPVHPTSEQVLLWPDTFNNYFHPETAIAAVEVLEAAGYQVRLPRSQVCCGRPLYDFGMLRRAKQLLIKTLAVLEREITSGTPIVVLEPSCASVFHDELLNLLPDDDRSRKLSSQVFLLSEFLEKKAPNFSIPKLHLSALLHGHCHQKSIMKMTDEEALLGRMGIEHQAPAPGCCGMAGAFGFEKDKYDVSRAIAELELLPAIRKAPLDSLLIADGFSCREQIKQCTGRRALHLTEVIQMALRQ